MIHPHSARRALHWLLGITILLGLAGPGSVVNPCVAYLNPALSLAFDRNPGTYLPQENDIILVTADTGMATAVEVTFELTQHDQFTFADGTTSAHIVTTKPLTGKASIEIKSTSYFGVAKVRATAGLSWDEQQIPIDSDNDGIADFWEITNGGADKANSADDEEVAGIDQKGDGFTKEDEYRGYTVGGTHYRMDPTKKELFFNTSSTATEKDFAKQGLTGLGLTIIEVPEDPTFLGGTIRTALQVAKDTYQSLNTDGDMVAPNGTIHDVEVIFGVAPLDTGQGTATVYEEAIHNLWNQNGVEETVRKVFKWNQATQFDRYEFGDLRGEFRVRVSYSIFRYITVEKEGRLVPGAEVIDTLTIEKGFQII